MFIFRIIILFVNCSLILLFFVFFFFFNDTATTEIYTLSLHDALPISRRAGGRADERPRAHPRAQRRSEEHTSELQSHSDLVCRLLLEKKKKNNITQTNCKQTKIPRHKIDGYYHT